mgnify:CR=1 FL=1
MNKGRYTEAPTSLGSRSSWSAFYSIIVPYQTVSFEKEDHVGQINLLNSIRPDARNNGPRQMARSADSQINARNNTSADGTQLYSVYCQGVQACILLRALSHILF